MLGYSTIYTSLPVFCLVFDEDADVTTILSFPPLYKTLQKGRSMNLKTFCIWLWKSIFQGTCILMLGLFLFHDSYANIVMITFTALIMIEILNVYTQIHRFTFRMMLMQVASAVVYFISIMLLKEYFDLHYIDLGFFYKVFFIVLVAWLPFQILKFLVHQFDPSDNEKVMNGKK